MNKVVFSLLCMVALFGSAMAGALAPLDYEPLILLRVSKK